MGKNVLVKVIYFSLCFDLTMACVIGFQLWLKYHHTAYTVFEDDESVRPHLQAAFQQADAFSFALNDTLPSDDPHFFPAYLRLLRTENLVTGQGAKSVVMDPYSKFVYCMNLEDMSVFEFERQSRQQHRALFFLKTPAKGFDYSRKKWFNSYEEKPVEACFSHDGRYLWVSLHNAGGVVVWDLVGQQPADDLPSKKVQIQQANGDRSVTTLPFFETGKTPKVMVETPDHQHLLVSNWHNNTTTVLDISSQDIRWWQPVHTIPTSSVPRGMAIAPLLGTAYIANMGNGHIHEVALEDMSLKQTFFLGHTPRHLLVHDGYLFASLSSPRRIVKYDLEKQVKVAETFTGEDPRTLAFSPDRSVLFVTCYHGESLQAFRTDNLSLLGSWKTHGKPVGVAVYQEGNLYEAWVCHYTGGYIKIFSLEARFEQPTL
jgi:6-phosphogluconolactonase (cycloisomerase 2 family)